MDYLIQTINAPALSSSCAARIGRRLVAIGFGLKAGHGLFAVILSIVLGVVSVSAQTPSGQFFNGDSAQLGNSLRSVTFFLAAAMIIAGIIFVAVGIITSGLRESLSTWKFITGAACFAFGGICAAVYAFSQGEKCSSRQSILISASWEAEDASTPYQTKYLLTCGALWCCRQRLVLGLADFVHLLSRTCAFRDHSIVCPIADVDVVAGNCRCNRFLQLHTDRAKTLLASASA
jgi:hypothetical protein